MFSQSYAEAPQGTSLHLEVTSPYPGNTNGWVPEVKCKLPGSLLNWAVDGDGFRKGKEGGGFVATVLCLVPRWQHQHRTAVPIRKPGT